MSQSHHEILERWHRSRDEDRLRAIVRQRVPQRFLTAPICRNHALQIGVKVLSEAEQDFRDRRFEEGKYASKVVHVALSSFYKPHQLEQPMSDSASVQMELRRRLWGEHIFALRKALGWTQQQVAAELGISRRSVIRHEKGQQLRPRMRNSLEMRLRQLESDYAEQLAAHLAL